MWFRLSKENVFPLRPQLQEGPIVTFGINIQHSSESLGQATQFLPALVSSSVKLGQ